MFRFDYRSRSCAGRSIRLERPPTAWSACVWRRPASWSPSSLPSPPMSPPLRHALLATRPPTRERRHHAYRSDRPLSRSPPFGPPHAQLYVHKTRVQPRHKLSSAAASVPMRARRKPMALRRPTLCPTSPACRRRRGIRRGARAQGPRAARESAREHVARGRRRRRRRLYGGGALAFNLNLTPQAC